MKEKSETNSDGPDHVGSQDEVRRTKIQIKIGICEGQKNISNQTMAYNGTLIYQLCKTELNVNKYDLDFLFFVLLLL